MSQSKIWSALRWAALSIVVVGVISVSVWLATIPALKRRSLQINGGESKRDVEAMLGHALICKGPHDNQECQWVDGSLTVFISYRDGYVSYFASQEGAGPKTVYVGGVGGGDRPDTFNPPRISTGTNL